MSLKLGTSGVRGTYVDLTPQIAAELSEAFSTYMDSGCIVLATDTRPSKDYLKHSVLSGLIATGARVDDYGVLPTPILQWLIKSYGYSGGVAISGGHTSFDWNSLVFLNKRRRLLEPFRDGGILESLSLQGLCPKEFRRTGHMRSELGRVESYFESYPPPMGNEKASLRHRLLERRYGTNPPAVFRMIEDRCHSVVLRFRSRLRRESRSPIGRTPIFFRPSFKRPVATEVSC